MTGAYRIRVRNARNDYIFTVRRNITVLRGNSGTGKTTLYELIRDWNRYGRASSVHVSCNKPVVALAGDDWAGRLGRIADSIVIIDEDSDFIMTHDFARAVRESDNYFILETRNNIPSLPYSVDEIFELQGNMNKRFKPLYAEIDRMYDRPLKSQLPFLPEVIITEDSKAGFQFFKCEADRLGIECVSAEGKAKLFEKLKAYRDKNVVMIADGAAFGNEMEKIVIQQRLTPHKLALFLPESFEWLILISGVVPMEVSRIARAEDYADSRKYMSWEQYFTDLLREATLDLDYMRYRKDALADYYTQESTAARIRAHIPGIKL